MSPYLYDLIGAFVSAIAHDLHLTVAPSTGAITQVTTLSARTVIVQGGMPAITPIRKSDTIMGLVHDNVSLAAIR